MFASIMLVALLADALAGWPRRLFDVVGHPVTWLGQMIGALDTRFNMSSSSPKRSRALGAAALVAVVAVATLPAALLQWALSDLTFGWLCIGLLAWPLVAARSLHEHVSEVLTQLTRGDLTNARNAVAMIVGRDVTWLDEPGIARATIESLAENTSDGVVAPLFWGALLGLPGIAAYKAVNTLDSMIGHKTERHADFGWASARFDDLMNLIPARLTGLLVALASGAPRRAFVAMMRDHAKHRSPNAGYPEAAMAGGLGVRLSGPRIYHDHIADEPWLNEGAADPDAKTLARALAVYRRCLLILAVLLLGLAWLAEQSILAW